MFSTLETRNLGYAVKHPVRTYRVKKACKNHVKKHPICRWCGTTKGIQAHHIIPLWKDESLGADPNNFISLCGKRCHLAVGHNGNFAKKFVENVVELCDKKYVQVRGRNNG